MPAVLTVGEILVEMMAREAGQSFLEPGAFDGPFASGAPAIFIDQVARMGVSCGMIARVGEDDFGELNLRRLQSDGVDVAKVRRTPGHTTGVAFVTYAPGGQRRFIFHFAHSAAGQLGPADIDVSYIASADYLHVMGCSLSAGERMRSAIERAVDVAHQTGATISFDPNLRPELLGGIALRRVFDKVLSAATIVLAGEPEALRITGAETADEAVRELAPRTVVLKRGAAGATLYVDGRRTDAPRFEVDEVDPTGAGDCFDGAFIASLALGMKPDEALRWASAAGAHGVTRQGPMEGAATRERLARMLEPGAASA